MITYGFYNSVNHDRRYNSIQFGRMFDGVIKDGIFMSIGTCFRVIPGDEMIVLVGIGRAWFDHTWTLNDAPLPIAIPQSEVLLDRIDAVVLDINSDPSKRVNDILVLKGTPSNTPQRPILANTENHHQYPLAYISVKAGATAIRAADITSMVGTSESPYVTGPLETVNIDALTDQWQDQWRVFFEEQSAEMTATNAYWEQQWESWYGRVTSENEQEWNTWEKEQQDEFQAWFESLQDTLSGDVAANLANEILKLQNRMDVLEKFKTDLENEQAIYYKLNDSSQPTPEFVLDSSGNPIDTRIIFTIKGEECKCK